MSISALNVPHLDGLEVEEAKQLLRSAVREHRKQRSQRQLAKMGEEWAGTVAEFVKDRELVACYVSTKLEPPTAAVVDRLHAAGKRILLPKLGPGLTRSWGFYTDADSMAQLAPGRPPEPTGEAFGNEILEEVEALVIPALAISHAGARLGQGGGWYDRALKCVTDSALVGAMIFPEEFLAAEIPQDSMDVAVPFVITPSAIIRTAAVKAVRK